jgi:sarcosine oxidase gamma subunit
MTDPIDRLQAIKERLELLMDGEMQRAAKLDGEISKLELEVVMASALAALKVAATDVRHERVRVQVQGARDMLAKVLAA